MLALNTALAYLEHEPTLLVYWVDTVGSYSPEQALSILGKRLITRSRQHGLSPESILTRLRVSLAFEIESAYSVLYEIINEDSDRCSGLIVIDSITSLFSSLLSSVTAQGHALMTNFMRSLQDVASNYGLIVLVLNKPASVQPPHSSPSVFTATKLKPALGPTFSFLTDTTLWLSRASDVLNVQANKDRGDGSSTTTSVDSIEELLIAEVVRSRSLTSRIWWPIAMKDGVLQERTCSEASEIDPMDSSGSVTQL